MRITELEFQANIRAGCKQTGGAQERDTGGDGPRVSVGREEVPNNRAWGTTKLRAHLSILSSFFFKT